MNFLPVEKKMAEVGMAKNAIAKEISFAKQLLLQNDFLAKCDPTSFLSAVVNVANVGLTLNPAAKEAYIVPRYNSRERRTEANLMPSYIGLIKLIIREGAVSSIIANVVHENDEFRYEPTNNRQPVYHAPNPFKDRGKIIGVYSVATLNDGTRQAEAMSLDEIEKIRDNSESYKNDKTRQYSPWVRHFDEMARKTVIRRIFKYLPRGNNEALNDAIDADDQDYRATFGQLNYIESLLSSSNISPEQYEKIEAEYMDYTYQQAKETIQYLTDNQAEQRDPAKQFRERAK